VLAHFDSCKSFGTAEDVTWLGLCTSSLESGKGWQGKKIAEFGQRKLLQLPVAFAEGASLGAKPPPFPNL
jgi:hypothetical protein